MRSLSMWRLSKTRTSCTSSIAKRCPRAHCTGSGRGAARDRWHCAVHVGAQLVSVLTLSGGLAPPCTGYVANYFWKLADRWFVPVGRGLLRRWRCGAGRQRGRASRRYGLDDRSDELRRRWGDCSACHTAAKRDCCRRGLSADAASAIGHNADYEHYPIGRRGFTGFCRSTCRDRWIGWCSCCRQ